MGKALVPFQSRSTICVSGPTSSGKSTFLARLLDNLDGMFTPDTPKRILFCYNVYQPLFDIIQTKSKLIHFHMGLPEESDIKALVDPPGHALLILDDLMEPVIHSS